MSGVNLTVTPLNLKQKCFDAGFFVDGVNILTLPEGNPTEANFSLPFSFP
jgi:hypothetical protein